MPNYSIVCAEAVDQSMSPNSCRDVFIIREQGTNAFELTFDYTIMDESGNLKPGANEGDCQAYVRCLNGVQQYPVSNGFELIGRVMDFLNKKLGETGHEFYGDMFMDESGECIELRIEF